MANLASAAAAAARLANEGGKGGEPGGQIGVDHAGTTGNGLDLKSPVLNQEFMSGENRDARLETETTRNLVHTFTGIFGGDAKFLAHYEKQREDEPWVDKFPGPHLDMGTYKAFSHFIESGAHGDQHMLVKEWTDKYGAPSNGNYVVPFATLGWGTPAAPKYWLVLNNPEDHLRIGTDNVKKSFVHNGGNSMGEHFLGEIDEDEWRRRRLGAVQSVQPTFIKGYFHRMERHARNLVKRLKDGYEGTFTYGASVPEPAFNLHEMVVDTAFKVAADTLLGLEDDNELQKWSRQIRWAVQRQQPDNTRAVQIMKDWATFMRNRPAEMRGPLLEAMIDTVEEHERGENIKRAEVPDAPHDPFKTFHDDLMLLTLAFHDTTAACMTSCLMELARKPDLQAQVAKEAREVVGNRAQRQSSRGQMTFDDEVAKKAMIYDDLYNMPLLTKCINETLRMWNPVPYGSMRQLENDEMLHCGPGPKDLTLVPKGTNFMLHGFTHHRDKNLWGPDANEWKPERWEGFADVNGVHFQGEIGSQNHHSTTYAARNPESERFHPFSRFPRDCFGKNFAQAEMRVVLPVLLAEMEFRLAEPTSSHVASGGPDKLMYMLSGVLKPRDGIWVHAVERAPDSKL